MGPIRCFLWIFPLRTSRGLDCQVGKIAEVLQTGLHRALGSDGHGAPSGRPPFLDASCWGVELVNEGGAPPGPQGLARPHPLAGLGAPPPRPAPPGRGRKRPAVRPQPRLRWAGTLAGQLHPNPSRPPPGRAGEDPAGRAERGGLLACRVHPALLPRLRLCSPSRDAPRATPRLWPRLKVL